MGREKQKAQKIRERKERIRREKHERRTQPQVFPGPERDGEEDVPSAPEPAGPHRFAAEQGLHDLHKLMEGRKFESVEEVNEFLKGAMNSGELRAIKDLPKDDIEIARDFAYQAMDADDPEEIERLSRRALSHDPECVDALRMMAFVTAKSPRERIAMLANAVQAGERALGAESFEENRGHFWGVLETRPYMRARYDLATALLREGETDEAVGHLEALLDLNEHDNQGVRYDLLPRYLEAGDLAKPRRLFDAYPNDYSAVFHWCRVLERYLAGDLKGAASALAKARKMNRYVEMYLTGGKLPPRHAPDRHSPGQPSEAAAYAKDLRNAWLAHRDAVAWLKDQQQRG